MATAYLGTGALGAACLALAACSSSGGGGGGNPGGVFSDATLADRFDDYKAAEAQVTGLRTADGFTRTARLPAGGATYAGSAAFATFRDVDVAIAALDRGFDEVEEVDWVSSVTLTADFDALTVGGRFTDFQGPRRQQIAGELEMTRTAIQTDGANEAFFEANVSGDLRDDRGRINVVGLAGGDFVGTRGGGIEGEVLGSAARPGQVPRAMAATFAAVR